jgi:predicted metal-dependent peptidase
MTNIPERLIETKSLLLNTQPYFSTLMYTALQVKYIPETPTASTDGKNIHVGDWWLALGSQERLFVLCHEILHYSMDHPGRGKRYLETQTSPIQGQPLDFPLWSQSGDYIINATLIESKIGRMPTGENARLFDLEIGTPDSVCEEVYTKLWEQGESGQGESGQGESSQGKSGQGQTRAKPGGFDEHLVPETAASPEEIRQQVTSALNEARAAGSLPGALERLLGGVVEPKISWPEQLADFMDDVATGCDSQTWRRINKRRLVMPPNVAMPGRCSQSLGTVVVAIDVSGSISMDIFDMFISELKEVFTTCSPDDLYVVFWDTEAVMHKIESLDDIVEPLGDVYGGGGTDYRCVPPVLQAEGVTPDVVVCFTDGWVIPCSEFDFPCPHVTLTTNDPMPFGRNIYIGDK